MHESAETAFFRVGSNPFVMTASYDTTPDIITLDVELNYHQLLSTFVYPSLAYTEYYPPPAKTV